MKIRFKNKLTKKEEKIKGIVDASLNTKKTEVKEYCNSCDIKINKVIYSVYYPDGYNKQYVVMNNLELVHKSTSLFKSIYYLTSTLINN